MSCMLVVVLIAATVFVTNMLVQNAKLTITDNFKHLEFYKRTVASDGSVTLLPLYEDVKNTFIMLHDYD